MRGVASPELGFIYFFVRAAEADASRLLVVGATVEKACGIGNTEVHKRKFSLFPNKI